MYNFDETGFQMGVISAASKVVTGLERRGRPKALQQGNWEWVIAIVAISACGVAIPLFIIFTATYHISIWYEGSNLILGLMIALSDIGWMNNELRV